jgi:hypothetical protein
MNLHHGQEKTSASDLDEERILFPELLKALSDEVALAKSVLREFLIYDDFGGRHSDCS